MKVKVKKLTRPYSTISSESLMAILRNHAQDKFLGRIGIEQLFAIMEELVQRRHDSDTPRKPAKEAWAEIWQFYLPATEGGTEILGSGKHV